MKVIHASFFTAMAKLGMRQTKMLKFNHIYAVLICLEGVVVSVGIIIFLFELRKKYNNRRKKGGSMLGFKYTYWTHKNRCCCY